MPSRQGYLSTACTIGFRTRKIQEEKHMKKLLATIMVVLMATALLVGCAQTPAATDTVSSDAAVATEEQSTETTEAPAAATEDPYADFPNQTITIICPYSAGGGTDLILRALADSASKIAGENIVVENVTGGNGMTGVVTMMAATPDGYTIGSCSGEWISCYNCNLAPEGFDYNNCERIMHYNFDPACIAVPADSPYTTLEEFVAAAQAAPSEITVATSAAGGAHHLTMLLFQSVCDTSYNVVTYSEGAAYAITAVLSNEADAVCVTAPEVAAQVEAGNLKILAIASANRLDKFSDVPTFTECGYAINYGSWRALAAPAGTPDEIVTKLETLFMQAAQTDEFVEFMANGGFTIDLLDKAGFEARWTEQLDLIGQACDIYNQQY